VGGAAGRPRLSGDRRQPNGCRSYERAKRESYECS